MAVPETSVVTSTTAHRSLWRDRRFLTYWTGQTLSDVGDQISALAIPLIAITLLDVSPAVVGLLTAAAWAPQVTAVLVGAWVDQRPVKRAVMIRADVVRAAVLLTVPVAFLADRLTIAQLFVVALVNGTAALFFQTAYSTFFVSLVRRDQLVPAASMVGGSRSGASIAGPALGGGLVHLLTAPLALAADALSFLVSATCLRRVDVDESARERETSTEPLLQRARAGLGFVVRHRYLAPTLATTTTLGLFSMAGNTLIILFASRTLGLSAATIGLALGIGASGGLAGAVLAPRLARRIGVGRSVVVGVGLHGVAFALLALAGGPIWQRAAVVATSEFLGALGAMLFDVNLQAIFTVVTPDRMRSRVAGAFATVNFGARPVGAVAAGFTAQAVGIVPTLVGVSVGVCLAAVWLVGSPVLDTRRVDDLGPVESGRVPRQARNSSAPADR